ncbi:NAD(+)/NADH kinase [Candidatus Aerophobetes bacterium]|nr:NAD(+)/NADH kinase [Candidatus Aerophobetes bacterium]
MYKTVGITINREKKGIISYTLSLIKYLKEKDIKVLLSLEAAEKIERPGLACSEEKIGKNSDLIISLGGDGTFFRTARSFAPYNIPLLGINLGGLGFLTEIPTLKFKESFQKILSGKYIIEKRLMLKTNVFRKEKKIKTFLALNDIVISKGAVSRIINLKTFVSGEFVTIYAADGLVISTPTGSTAYSLSTGGPVVYPNLKVIILSPICAHTLSVRPLIISQKDKIEIMLEPPSDKVLLTIDGQIGFELKDKYIIKVEKAECEASLIRLEGTSFFKTLRTKFGWSGVSHKTNKNKERKIEN